MEKGVLTWVKSAEYDLETAEAMLKSGRYIYTVFMCHLALEKILKAKVEEVTKKIPPKTHDLEWLLELSKLQIDSKLEEHLLDIGGKSVPTRYLSDFDAVMREFTRPSVELVFKQTKEAFSWIRKSPAP